MKEIGSSLDEKRLNGTSVKDETVENIQKWFLLIRNEFKYVLENYVLQYQQFSMLRDDVKVNDLGIKHFQRALN